MIPQLAEQKLPSKRLQRAIAGQVARGRWLTSLPGSHTSTDSSSSTAWGIHLDRVEIKVVELPESMKRSMSKQAEAERERRARVITADGEQWAAQSLAEASRIMADTPGALQLRLLQTVVEVAAEKNSTLVMPFPIELLRFFERYGREPEGHNPAAGSGEMGA